MVFQGASVAFDLSIEEIWVPYLVGATLFVASPGHDGRRRVAARHPDGGRITVLDTVPTLLAHDQPATCRRSASCSSAARPCRSRWSPAGPARSRKLFNTYGPTEATVVATAAEMRPGEPVTIGGPIPNYTIYVADEDLNLLGPASRASC